MIRRTTPPLQVRVPPTERALAAAKAAAEGKTLEQWAADVLSNAARETTAALEE